MWIITIRVINKTSSVWRLKSFSASGHEIERSDDPQTMKVIAKIMTGIQMKMMMVVTLMRMGLWSHWWWCCQFAFKLWWWWWWWWWRRQWWWVLQWWGWLWCYFCDDDEYDNDGYNDEEDGDVAEATIRFLKAKVRVMQEELDRLSQENNKKVSAYLMYQKKTTWMWVHV